LERLAVAGEIAHVYLAEGITLSVDLREVSAQKMRDSGIYDVSETELLRRLLRPGSVFLDVGANVGYYTCLAAKLIGKQGMVHAFEANPWTARYLRRSVRLNGVDDIVEIVPAAVTTQNADGVRLYTNPERCATPLGSLLACHNWGRFTTYFEVPGLSLDTYVEEQGLRVDVVKMDIEGAEIYALRGFAKTLANNPPTAAILELVDDGAVPSSEIVRFMEEFGFTGFVIGPDGQLDELTVGSNPGHVNAIFVADRGLIS
jgi:FkbM family methyltransferase